MNNIPSYVTVGFNTKLKIKKKNRIILKTWFSTIIYPNNIYIHNILHKYKNALHIKVSKKKDL